MQNTLQLARKMYFQGHYFCNIENYTSKTTNNSNEKPTFISYSLHRRDLNEFLLINSKYFLCSIFDEACGYILKPEIPSEEMRKNK